jgi:hypothetical protein
VTLLLSAQQGVDPNSVTPGVLGFLATFAVVVASILLFLNMNRRLRRMRHREEQARRQVQEKRADGTDDEDTPGPQG